MDRVFGDRVFGVNLDSSRDRWAVLTEHFSSRGVRVQRWRASVGKEMDVRTLIEAGIVAHDADFLGTVQSERAGVVGVLASNVRLWAHLASLGDFGWALVLEDDAVVRSDLTGFEESWRALPADADFVYLGFTVNRQRGAVAYADAATWNGVFSRVTDMCTGAFAYAVNPSGVRKLLASLPLSRAVDCFSPTLVKYAMLEAEPSSARLWPATGHIVLRTVGVVGVRPGVSSTIFDEDTQRRTCGAPTATLTAAMCDSLIRGAGACPWVMCLGWDFGGCDSRRIRGAGTLDLRQACENEGLPAFNTFGFLKNRVPPIGEWRPISAHNGICVLADELRRAAALDVADHAPKKRGLRVAFRRFEVSTPTYMFDRMREHFGPNTTVASDPQSADVVVFTCLPHRGCQCHRTAARVCTCNFDEAAALKESGKVTVFYTGENCRPPMDPKHFTAVFSFDYLESERHFRMPFAVMTLGVICGLTLHNDERGLTETPDGQQIRNVYRPLSDSEVDTLVSGRQHFCGFVSRSGLSPHRVSFVKALSNQYKSVTCPGKVLNNVERIGSSFADALAFYRKCKFAVVMENSSSPGYVTEKLVMALLAGCIPVYWGDTTVDTLVDPEVIINYTGKSFEECLALIEKVDGDETLQRSMLRKSAFMPREENTPEWVWAQFNGVISGALDSKLP